MKFNKSILSIIFIFFVNSSLANEVSLQEKLDKLMVVSGIYDEFLLNRQELNKNIPKLAQQMLNTYKKNTNINGAYEERAYKAYKNYLMKIQNAVSVEEETKEWYRLVTLNLNESEVDELISFYSSPIGQKMVKANREATPIFVEYLTKVENKLIKSELKNLNETLNNISDEYYKNDGTFLEKLIFNIF